MNYGWKPSLPDYRDYKLKINPPQILPEVVDLRAQCPAVYNQGLCNDCTANAIAGAIEFDLLKQGKKDFTPSRLFIYYNERVIENSIGQDDGAQIKDGIKSISKIGICDEKVWPFDISKIFIKPPQSAYNVAKNDLITIYKMIGDGNIGLMKETLSVGFPFIFGFTVFSNFESLEVKKTGILSMPQSDESVIGGHAVLCVGYNDKTQQFIIRNSWGADWGIKGYFMMPYEYMRTMASDLWVINAV